MERAMFQYRAIERAELAGIGCAIPIAPLAKVVAEMGLDPALANPYYLAWRAVITLTLEGASILGSREPVEFVFDDQSEKVNIIAAWEYFRSGAPRSIRKRIRGVPSFENDEEVVPLQAADMIAWWARKQYMTDKANMKNLFPIEWTNGTEPTLLFTEMREEQIRTQLTRDIEIAKRRASQIGLHSSFKHLP